jgi:hypothetical protein
MILILVFIVLCLFSSLSTAQCATGALSFCMERHCSPTCQVQFVSQTNFHSNLYLIRFNLICLL